MIISLADGYVKAINAVEEIVHSRYVAINTISDAIAYPIVPAMSDDGNAVVTYFPAGKMYGSGIYSISCDALPKSTR